jgi:hypothetical protein
MALASGLYVVSSLYGFHKLRAIAMYHTFAAKMLGADHRRLRLRLLRLGHVAVPGGHDRCHSDES